MRGFYVFIACIALGVAAIAGVNSVSRAFAESISVEGRVILGGDVAFTLAHREATPEELQFFGSKGGVGKIATMRAMARRADENAQALVELKAVDAAYPHGGSLLVEGRSEDAAVLLLPQDGRHGALVAPELLDRLGVGLGEEIRLGTETLQIRGAIRTEPDRLSAGIGFGPRLIVSLDALRASGLVRPGSLINWIYRISLAENAASILDVGRVRAEARQRFPEAGWSVRSRDNAAPSLSRNIERFSQFLTLVGLTALVVGGVGVANAVASFVDLKRPAIATLKCLGARNGTVFRIYLTQILILASLGILIGLVIGALLPFAARAALADLMPVSTIGLYWRELSLAILYGFLVTLSFALGPLGRARQMPAASLFADRAIHSPVGPPLRYIGAQAVALLALAALAIALAGDRELALLYVASVVVAFVVLKVVGWGIMQAASRAGSIKGTTLRLAIRNIHRPGALTTSVVLSLGLGLTLLVSLALIDSNLRGQLSGTIAGRAPDFFFLDIQDSERERFAATIQQAAPRGDLETVPMLRGRIVLVNGVPAAGVRPRDGSWALRGDRGVTYSETVPENSTVIAGEWWPADYEGEPLVSMEADIAKGLGLSIGDTITVNILGRDITARIANFRQLEWESLSINFVMVFSPNTLAGAPHAHLATLRLPEGSGRAAEKQVLSAVTRDVSRRHSGGRPRGDRVGERHHR